jgi:hypothetical protein
LIRDVHQIVIRLHSNLRKSFNPTPHERYHAETVLKMEVSRVSCS